MKSSPLPVALCRRMKKTLSILAVLWRCLVAAGMVALLAELVLRLFIMTPAATIHDPDIGWTYKGGSSVLQSSEGYGRFELNQFGWNDEPFDPADPRPRVLLLGDSYTQAFQVERSLNYASLAEQETCLNVLNTARADMSVLHYLALARRYADLSPTTIVVAFTGGDIKDLQGLDYQVVREPASGQITEIVMRFEPERSPLKQALRAITEHSALAALLWKRARILLTAESETAQVAVPAEPQPSTPERPLDTKAAIPDEVREVFEYALRELGHRASLRLLFIPDYLYFSEGRTQESSYSRSTGAFLDELARREGIPLVRVAGLDTVYRETGHPPVGFANTRLGNGHLNEEGHRLVADGLVNLLGRHCTAGN